MAESRRIAVVGIFPHLAFAVPEFEDFVIAGNYAITQDSPSDLGLVDSFVSTPSRYLLEVVRRVAATGTGTTAILVFNPLLRPPAFLVRMVMSAATGAPIDTVFRCSNGYPVAYLLDWRQMADFRHLLLLSCSAAELDRHLLETAFGRRFGLMDLAFPAPVSLTNGFLFGDYRKPMEWCAAHAIKVLQQWQASRRAEDGGSEADGMQRPRLAAFFTHHAGDMLFMSIAANRATAPLYDEIVIHEDYVPIARKLIRSMPILPAKGPVPFRGSYRREDCRHFLDVAPTLPPDRLYVYCRTTRNYNFTNFHYVDHFRFCLGEPLTARDQLHNGVPAFAAPRPAGYPVPAGTTVLLHFDAGWPLKVYPRENQITLARLLAEQGLKVVVLDAPGPTEACETVRFSGLPALDSLLDEVAVVVGMDSFPAHYAAQVRAIPTIHLFSSTHPVHSGTGAAAPHLMLQNGERCCPCLGWDRCVRYGGRNCRNFSQPETVADHVMALLGKAAGPAKALPPLPPPPSDKCPAQFAGRHRKTIMLAADYLDPHRIRRLLPFMRAALIPGTILTLVEEFVQAVRHEGPRKAIFLTLAFIRRRFFKQT